MSELDFGQMLCLCFLFSTARRWLYCRLHIMCSTDGSDAPMAMLYRHKA